DSSRLTSNLQRDFPTCRKIFTPSASDDQALAQAPEETLSEGPIKADRCRAYDRRAPKRLLLGSRHAKPKVTFFGVFDS
ncbi:MAG: hypothetical protein ACREQT_14985, partial [Candidatus Binataceae bacterium]